MTDDLSVITNDVKNDPQVRAIDAFINIRERLEKLWDELDQIMGIVEDELSKGEDETNDD